MENKIEISNLNDVEDLLARIKKGEIVSVEDIKINFVNVVNFKIYGDPERYNGTIPSSLAQGMCEFQTELYKAFTLVRHGTDNLKHLTKNDREELEIIFKVEPGCTDLIVGIKDVIDSFGIAFERSTQGMTGTEKAICLVLISLLLTGAWLIKSHLKNKHENGMKQLEIDAEKNNSNAETERMRILKDGIVETLSAVSATPAAREISDGVQNHTANAVVGVLKGVSDAERVEFNGLAKIELDQKDIKEMIQNPREKMSNSELTVEVEIEGIKKTPEKLTVTCRKVGEDYSFPAYVLTEFFDKEETDLLYDAMKDSDTAQLFGDYKLRSGIIELAMISRISK
ncbi:TPA: hypothetical protein ACUU9M_000008 [Yersinia enterocolitica]|uniref:hypothetical protein n=1 Tax=Yersinia bercovieri TaxID=634 RepID=UPI001CFEC170|nr:hypothetical protein [Yersinia bercovieri]HDW7088607.1 hypothetical protein [Yersinia enterocolitica]MCB5301150.1 hypothetical protein [Yersinia bercovieri]HEB0969567.1 hypothetical protein [Yersinia enterocolitica]HEB1846620.1 hypothetical protein [Yersinia enterocolitica]HEG7100210.1 hypothetical protein [Yersinia enterocolitica]